MKLRSLRPVRPFPVAAQTRDGIPYDPAATKRIPLRDRDGNVRAETIVETADFEWLNQWRWCLGGPGYVQRREGGQIIYMHRLILGLAAGDERYGDHCNGDRLDNRRSNLRCASNAENQQNRGTTGRGSSGHRGVSFDRVRGLWRAQVMLSRRNILVGRYATEEEAARAAAQYRAEHMPFSPDARDAAMTPRIAAIRLLQEQIHANRAGLDPFDPAIFLLDVRGDERLWANRVLERTGLVLGSRLHRDGIRYRALLDADVRGELGLDRADAPTLDDEPLASRGVRVLTLQEGRLADEGPARAALDRAHEAWALRYPNGITEAN